MVKKNPLVLQLLNIRMQTLIHTKILDGSTVFMKSSGPFVRLDSVLKVPANVGKTFKVRGLYQGKEFAFKSSAAGKTEKSVWQFSN